MNKGADTCEGGREGGREGGSAHLGINFSRKVHVEYHRDEAHPGRNPDQNEREELEEGREGFSQQPILVAEGEEGGRGGGGGGGGGGGRRGEEGRGGFQGAVGVEGLL